jgi:hypothetical protein
MSKIGEWPVLPDVPGGGYVVVTAPSADPSKSVFAKVLPGVLGGGDGGGADLSHALLDDLAGDGTSGTNGRFIWAEDYGAKGDGITDDTAAFAAAMASNLPFHLAEKTYVVNGQLAPTAATLCMIGTPGRSKIVRTATLASGNWITFGSPSTRLDGVIFDAAGLAAVGSAFITTAAVTAFAATDCGFARGDALIITGSATPGQRIEVIRCECYGMSYHGLYLKKVQNALVTGNRFHDNAADGLLVAYSNDADDPAAAQLVITDNWAWNNTNGLWVGNFTVGVSTPPVPGETDPVAIRVVIANNHAWNNSRYGISAQCDYALVDANQAYNNGTVANVAAQILFCSRWSRASNNLCHGGNVSYAGMDAGGSIYSAIDGNDFGFAAVGLNLGAASHVTVRGNRFHDLVSDHITMPVTDGTLEGLAFPHLTSDITIRNNTFDISTINSGAFKYAVHAWDGPKNIRVLDNDFYSSSAVTAFFAARGISDTFYVSGNRWNGAALVYTRTMGGATTLIIPTICDVVQITDAATVNIIGEDEQSFFATGQVLWLTPTAAGSGYTSAPTVTITGAGTGATAAANVWNGTVVGYRITNPGSGYTTASVAVTGGGGTGATATAQVGQPVHAERRLRMIWAAGGTLGVGGAPYAPITLPGGAATLPIPSPTVMDLHYANGAWQVTGVPLFGANPTASGVVTGQTGLTAGTNTATATTVTLNGAVSTNRVLQYQTAGVLRWKAQVSATNDDYALTRYNDAGANQGNAIYVARADGLVTLGAGLKVTTGLSAWAATPPAAKPTVSGAKGSNAALGSLLAALVSYGLVTDTTTA